MSVIRLFLITPSEFESPHVLVVRARRRHLAGRILRSFLLDVGRLLLERWDRGEEAFEVDDPFAERRVAGAAGGDVLHMEAPEAIGILLEVLHRIAAPERHVADVELQPGDGGIEAVDEHVERHLAVDRPLVVGLVVEPQPDPGAARDGARGVEAIGPFPPVIERLFGPAVEVGDEQVLVAELLRDGQAALPAHEDGLGRHVTGRRAQPFVLQGRGDLRRCSSEVAERPQQLDIGVTDGPDRRQRALGIFRHRVAHREQLKSDAVELLGRELQEGAGGDGAHRLDKVASFHSALIYGSLNVSASDIVSAMIHLIAIVSVLAGVQDTTLSVIPEPVQLTRTAAAFALTPGTAIVTDRSTYDIGIQLADWLQPGTGYRLAVVGAAG